MSEQNAELPPGFARLKRWEQQEAKAKFSEVVRRARGEGPQLVTTRGAKPVVVLSGDEYLELTRDRPVSVRDLFEPIGDFEPARLTMPARFSRRGFDLASRYERHIGDVPNKTVHRGF